MLGLVEGEHVVGYAVVLGYVTHAVAIRAVAQDEEFVARLDGTSYDGLHAVGAAALHQHRGVLVGGCGGQADEGLSDFFYDVYVVVFVPRAPVGQHGLFHAVGRGEGAGGKQNIRSHVSVVFSRFY